MKEEHELNEEVNRKHVFHCRKKEKKSVKRIKLKIHKIKKGTYINTRL